MLKYLQANPCYLFSSFDHSLRIFRATKFKDFDAKDIPTLLEFQDWYYLETILTKKIISEWSRGWLQIIQPSIVRKFNLKYVEFDRLLCQN